MMANDGSINMGVEGTGLSEDTALYTTVSGAGGTKLTSKSKLIFKSGSAREVTVYFKSDSDEFNNVLYVDDVVLEMAPEDFNHYYAEKDIPLPPIEDGSNRNLLMNSGFEMNYLSPWYFPAWGAEGALGSDPLGGVITPTGNKVMEVVGRGSGVQLVNVKPHTAYRLTGLTYKDAASIFLGIKGDGTTEKCTLNTLSGSEYGWMKHDLLFSTGDTTTLKVYAHIAGNDGSAYADDVALREAAHQAPFTPSGEAPEFPGTILAEHYDGVWLDGEFANPQGISCYSKTAPVAADREQAAFNMEYFSATIYEPLDWNMAIFISTDEWAEYTLKLDRKSADWQFGVGIQTYDSDLQLEFSINDDVAGVADIEALTPWENPQYSNQRYDTRMRNVNVTIPQSIMEKYEGQVAVLRIKVFGGDGKCKVYTITGE